MNKSRFCSTMCICFGGAAGANFIFESCFLWYTWPDNTSRLLNGVTALGTNSVRGDTWLQISIISTSLENPLLYLPTPLGYQKLIITFTVHTFEDYSMCICLIITINMYFSLPLGSLDITILQWGQIHYEAVYNRN